MSKGFSEVRRKGVKVLAWATFGLAVVGGALIPGTWIGEILRNIVGILPWSWLPPVLLLGGVIAVGLDLFIDGIPNQIAVAGGLLLPTLAAAVPGKLGDTVTEWSTGLLNWMSAPLTEWTGTNSNSGLAFACIVAVVLMSRRVIAKSGGRGGNH